MQNEAPDRSSTQSLFETARALESWLAQRAQPETANLATSVVSEERTKEKKPKWGTCGCGYALCPLVYKSGRQQGELRLVGRGFFKRVDGKPCCWLSQDFPMTR